MKSAMNSEDFSGKHDTTHSTIGVTVNKYKE